MKKLATISFRSRRKNRVIVFANQKGGAGKSTLCTEYCHLLNKYTERPFVVVDADPQRTILKLRKKDVSEFPDKPLPFNVYHFNHIDDKERTLDFMNDALDRDADVIIDSPGTLTEGMRVMLMKADLIICPTSFDKGSILSTIAFIKFIKQTAEEMGLKKHPPIIFVINRYNKNWGKSGEIKVWRETERKLKLVGELAPKVNSMADMTRYSTLYITPKQEETTKPFFDYVENFFKKRTA